MMNPFSSASSAKSAQQGFTLIELMIALAIGLVVVLGAGKLFLIGLQGFRTVESLSSKQEAMNFSAVTLVRDIRRASIDTYGNPLISFTDGELKVRFVNNGDVSNCNGSNELVYRVYRLGNQPTGNEGYSLNMGESCEAGLYSLSSSDLNYQPLVAGFAESGFQASSSSSGVWNLHLTLNPGKSGSADEIQFYSVNRTRAVN